MGLFQTRPARRNGLHVAKFYVFLACSFIVRVQAGAQNAGGTTLVSFIHLTRGDMEEFLRGSSLDLGRYQNKHSTSVSFRRRGHTND